MDNITIKLVGDKLIITIENINKDNGVSASGKSNIVATTGGNIAVEGANGLVLGLNAYRKIAVKK